MAETNQEVATSQSKELVQLEQETMTKLMLTGDMAGLNENQRIVYYQKMCNHLQLDPVTLPFSILALKGKTVLYANKGCAAQLNLKHHINHEIKSREFIKGLYVVTAFAKTKDGRFTENIGAIPIQSSDGKDFCGETLANAMMKAETKAKRRATLDLVGLGMPDVSEVETIADAQIYTMDENTGALKEEKPFYDFRYETIDDLIENLKKCSTPAHVGKLYFANQQFIDANPQLKDAFTAHRDSLKGVPQAQESEVVKEEAPKVDEGNTTGHFNM